MECLAQLTQRAIAQSTEIEAINQQLALTNDRQDYAEARQWTNYLTLDPIRLVQNVLGGGDVQRDRLAIAALELEAANLSRRRKAVAEEITREVVDLVLDYEKQNRQLTLTTAQYQTQQQRQAVMEAVYRTGSGATSQVLTVWQRTEDIAARCQEQHIDQAQTVRELEVLVDGDSLQREASPSCKSTRTHSNADAL
ncbi:MAG: hypothetical protein F6K31_33065 [Symploca sp. SIO2G7]|nr:hypothetical protein [Symploca sp. SIO2G7]